MELAGLLAGVTVETRGKPAPLTAALLFGVAEEEGVVFDADAGFFHEVGDGVLPAEVVFGLLVGGEVFFFVVDLVEEEAGGVVLGLGEVEAKVGGFAAGVEGVVHGGFDEGGDVFGFDENGNADDEHAGLLSFAGRMINDPQMNTNGHKFC